MRTTALQVSGHAFLVRMCERALVLGDGGMSGEPLRAQRRAVFVGVLLTALVAGVAAALAVMRPQPSIEDAGIVVDDAGGVYVRVDDTFHPVTNVASARLLLGRPDPVVRTTAQELRRYPEGPPVGIPVAPELTPAERSSWYLCSPAGRETGADAGHVEVVAGPPLPPAGSFLAETPGDSSAPGGGDATTWLVTDGSRSRIDAGAARAFGVRPVPVDPVVLDAVPRGPDIVLPRGPSGLPAPFDVQGRIVRAGGRMFLVVEGGVGEVHGAQQAFAGALAGVDEIDAALSTVLALPEKEALPGVPADDVEWAHPGRVCVGGDAADRDGPAGIVVADGAGVTGGPGTTDADRDSGGAGGPGATDAARGGTGDDSDGGDGVHLRAPRGSAALVTERGLYVVSDAGVRFRAGSADELAALGLGDPTEVPWSVIAVLPDGGELTADRARRTVPAHTPAATSAESTTGIR
ncbi:type VII secretion protein EccB [Corynebacterium bovis]|uniref:type VII secretion protein EccB n=1 Tax=Corynebacterium bovis TaxID=36808 RepID=UPI0025513FB8|nr:type VII secretion protein EccB [Corynebacterium bovis]MDK8511719.1 type VII secretion protein EccB [Corynebacterium bovis]